MGEGLAGWLTARPHPEPGPRGHMRQKYRRGPKFPKSRPSPWRAHFLFPPPRFRSNYVSVLRCLYLAGSRRATPPLSPHDTTGPPGNRSHGSLVGNVLLGGERSGRVRKFKLGIRSGPSEMWRNRRYALRWATKARSSYPLGAAQRPVSVSLLPSPFPKRA